MADIQRGRGVFSCRHFHKGDFLVEYRGQVITKQDYESRLRLYHDGLQVFIFEFCFNGKQLWIDAAREDGSHGRLVNDNHVNPNSKIKTIAVDGKPHLCLFAIKDISPGEEITYSYGDCDWPWRSKRTPDKEQQPNGLVSCAAEDATEKISTEAAPQDNTEQISTETSPQLGLNDDIQQIQYTRYNQTYRMDAYCR
ncbi:histone-lysine N-methyltransferase set-1-like isoform X5 [Trachinotus anak]|uniref:histone-lysine N-methyltransferase set-1-like isoform X5 n=1 Tax=Trachinotus anak TaxID=443729 RepID=UPI0039F24911